MKQNDIKKYLLLSGLGILLLTKKVLDDNHKYEAVVLDEISTNEESKKVVLNLPQEIEETVRESISETLPEVEQEPEPEIEILHHVPNYDQIIEYILNHRVISRDELMNFLDYCIEASQEYTIPYQSREQVARMLYLIVVKPVSEKRKYIEERWGMTPEELQVSECVTTGESLKINNVPHYGDSFGIGSVTIGRTKEKGYSKNGGDVYDQFTAGSQFTVYSSGAYHKFEDTTNYGLLDALFGYAYCKDMGLTPLRFPFYKEFRSASNKKQGRVQLFSNGNNYLKDKGDNTDYYVTKAWESLDSYQPYRELTDEYFHEILESRGLCYHEEVLVQKRTR